MTREAGISTLPAAIAQSPWTLLVACRAYLWGARGFAPRDLAAHERQQFAAVVDRIFQRVEAANQERRHAEIIVGEQRFGDLRRRADQRGGVAARSGRRGDLRPQPLVEHPALRGRGEQALRAGILRGLLRRAERGAAAKFANRLDDLVGARPCGLFGRG